MVQFLKKSGYKMNILQMMKKELKLII